MESYELAEAKFIIQRFFATVFADEISKDLYDALKQEVFLKELKNAAEQFYSKELRKGAGQMVAFLDRAGMETFRRLRYEYADLFLNAGDDPVIPYESFYVDREPTH